MALCLLACLFVCVPDAIQAETSQGYLKQKKHLKGKVLHFV